MPQAHAASGTYFDNVVVILMENNAINNIYNQVPFQTTLANTYTLSTAFSQTGSPSEPNYLALFAGNNFYSSDGNCCFQLSNTNLVDRLEAAGLTWTAFAEDASGSGTCGFSPPRSGDHFPFIDFSDMQTSSRCSHFQSTSSTGDPEFIAALNQPNPSNLIWLTPNDQDNSHDSSPSTGDNYLSALVPLILSSATFTTKRAALFILYDEAKGYGSSSNCCVYASWSGPVAKKAFQSNNPYSHYSLLHTVEQNWGLSTLANDAGAPVMTEFFGASTPPPLTTTFTFSSSSPTVNTPVTFTASATGGTSPYSFSWNFGDGTTRTGASVTHVYPSTQSFSVTETATDSSLPSQNAVSSQTITISAPPPPSTSFTFLPATPIVNSLVTFSAITIGGTAPYSVSWNFGDGASSTGTSVAHTFASAQSFTVKETATDSSTPTQTATSSQSVTVVTTPPLSATLQVSSSSPQVGQTVTFTASATGGTLPYIYAIDFGDGATGTGSTTTHAYSIAGTYTAKVTVSDSALPKASISKSVTVNVQALIPPALTVPGNQTITAGTWINFTLTAASLNIGGTTSLSATGLPAGASFNQTTGGFSWKPGPSQTGSYTVVFTATDSSYPSTPTSKPMVIQVNQAAPGGSSRGNVGSSGSSNGGCTLCGVLPKISANLSLLVIGGLLGLVASLGLLTIRARASLERTKRRLRI